MLTRGTLAFAVTLAACPLVLALLRRLNVLDTPNARSSHDTPTPRGGGLAVAAGALVALSVSPVVAQWRAPLITASVLFGLLGLADDLNGVAAIWRLAAQFVIAAALLPLLLRDLTGSGPWRVLFALGVLLWLVSYVNAFNFMDGINGIAAMQAFLAGGTWLVIGRVEAVPALAWAGAIVAGAAAAFAPYNFPRARIFIGDVGSYFVGAWLAVLVVVGLRAGLPPEAVMAPVALALVDTMWTLLQRCRRRAEWHQPHAEHAYQRLVRGGWSHATTTLFIGALIVASSALGTVSLARTSIAIRLLADGLLAAILVAYLLSPQIISRRWASGSGEIPTTTQRATPDLSI